MARYDDLNTSAIAYATFVSTILFVIIVLLTSALSYNWLEAQESASVADAHYTIADKKIASQKALTNTTEEYEVEIPGEEGADPVSEKRQRIPVSDAKDAVMKQFANSNGKDA